METKNDTGMTGRQHLRNLFIIMSSSLLLGILIVYFMATNFGPSGLYQLDHVLLSPENISQMSYMERNSSTGKSQRMILHDIQYFHPSKDGRFWSKSSVGNLQYSNFYKLISNLTSVAGDSEELIRPFSQPGMTNLSIVVKPDVVILKPGDYRVFQEVQFAGDGNHFRVQLHTDDPGQVDWVYFTKEGIGKEADSVLLETNP